MTNDGNCILREVDVSHPAAKSMIELSRAQDEEVGDGTTSVIILSQSPPPPPCPPPLPSFSFKP
jgi:chaperonin GroEL (HSP60 family)